MPPETPPPKPDGKSGESGGLGLAVSVGIAVVIVWAASAVFIRLVFEDSEKQGQFGDMFGAVNPLFSGLAFAGVIVAILLQREELKLQRKELEEGRKEQAKQTAILSGQLQAMQASVDAERARSERTEQEFAEKQETERRLAMPHIRWEKGSGAPGAFRCEFENAGTADIYDITWLPPDGTT